MNYKTDVLVIGAGAIGICSAYYIRDRGLNVTVVEKGEVCSGSSYGNAGTDCAQSLCSPGSPRGRFQVPEMDVQSGEPLLYQTPF